MTTAVLSTPRPHVRKGLHLSLWIVQAVLGALFLFVGFVKLTTPPDELIAMGMAYVSATPTWLLRFIGLAELAGGIGLVLPAATRIRPMLTPLAAAGLAVVMLLAALVHLARGEYGALPLNAVLGGLAVLVAWGRTRGVPIAAR